MCLGQCGEASFSLHLESWQMGFQATPGPPRREPEKHGVKNMVVSVSSPPKDLYILLLQLEPNRTTPTHPLTSKEA